MADHQDTYVIGNGSASHLLTRHPIFDREREVFGYEVLYGDGDADDCAYAISGAINVVGLPKVLAGKKAFIPLTRDALLAGDFRLMPSDSTMI